MSEVVEVLRQVGWRSRTTGEVCDCPAYELSPHGNHDPVYAATVVLAIGEVQEP